MVVNDEGVTFKESASSKDFFRMPPRPAENSGGKQSAEVRCTIDVFSAADFSPALFEQEYSLKKPVLVRGVQARPTGDGWTTANLLKQYLYLSLGFSANADFLLCRCDSVCFCV